MGIFDMFGGGGKSSDPIEMEKYEAPKYEPSPYDEPASKSIYDFYDPRIKGQNLGYSEEDLKVMNAQAQDHGTNIMNEAIRRGAAGRRTGTGGTWTGGRDVMRDEAIRSGLVYRSNAMRDVAVRNAVLKHQDQWGAATGMQNFLNSERSNALAKWTGESGNAKTAFAYNELYPTIYGNQQNLYKQEDNYAQAAELAKLGMNLFKQYQQSQNANKGY